MAQESTILKHNILIKKKEKNFVKGFMETILGNLSKSPQHDKFSSNINYKYNSNCAKGQTVYKLDFKVYSWGGNTKYLKEQISLQHFINNFYGYIKVK